MKSVPVLLALLMIGLALPLVLGKVPPNAFYGFRTPKTQRNPQIWYAANRAAGINLTVAAVLSLATWTAVRVLAGAARANVTGMTTLCVLLLGAFAVSMVQLQKM